MLGTNGGGFFNVNSAMPFENPTGLSNFVEMLLILIIPAGLTATFGRFVGNRRQGWALYGAMLIMFVASVAVVYAAEGDASPAQHLAGLRRRPGQSGGQGAALRHRLQRPLHGDHHGRLLRRGQRRLRLAHRHRRPGSDVQHLDRRGGVRRSGLRALRNAAVRRPRSVHRRADGRAHARVPGQEDRGPRGQAGDGGDAVRAAGRAARRRAGDRHEVRRSLHLQPGAAGLLGDRSTPTSPRATTTAPPSPATPATPSPTAPTKAPSQSPSPTCWAGWRCSSAVSFRSSPPSPWRGPLAPKRVSPLGPGTFRTDTGTFVVLLIATIVIVAALTFFPAFLLGPVVQGLTDQLF